MIKWGMTVLVLLSLCTAWLMNMGYIFSDETETKSSQLSPLALSINKCTSIAEHSVAHLQEIVAFQRLEKIGRQARVMRLCMTDEGYSQANTWTAFAKQQAVSIAKEEHISVDEAYENLRRKHMVLLQPAKPYPIFWQSQQ